MKKLQTLSMAVALAGAFSVAQAATTTCTDTPKQYGPITIKKVGTKCFAEIDADGEHHNEPVEITTTETVDSVYYYRKNSATSAKQTVVLPVYPSNTCKPSTIGANLKTIKKIYFNADNKWSVLVNPITTSKEGFEANRPYLIEFNSSDNNGLFFKLGGSNCTFDLNTTKEASTVKYSADPDSSTKLPGIWELRGVYSQKTWAAGDIERKKSYGFVGEKTKGKIGEFRKAGENASVPPLRAYLVYKSNGTLAKAAPGKSFALAADDSDLLPASMEVIEEGDCFQEGDGIFEVRMTNNKVTACLDDTGNNHLGTLNITEDIEVDSVAYNRKFVPGAVSSIMLPFEGKKHGDFFGAMYYKFAGLNKWCETCPLYAAYTDVDTVYANTPYLVVASSSAESIIKDSTLEFSVGKNSTRTKFILNTTNGGNKVSYAKDPADESYNMWEFRGTYEYKEWSAGNSDLGRVYGFVAKPDTIDGKIFEAGKFVKAKAGAKIPAMRAYLRYNRVQALAKAADGSEITEEDLPETIVIKLIGKDGETLSIGQMNTITGEITMDENKWFDMKGRVLNKKPTAKGTYYNKGQKVIIK